MIFPRGFESSRAVRYGLIALLVISSMLAGTSLLLSPVKGRPLTLEEFREGKVSGAVFTRLSKKEFGKKRYGLEPGVWVSGKRVMEVGAVDELSRANEPAFRVREGNALYINESLRKLLSSGNGDVVLALDLPGAVMRAAHLGGSAFLLLGMLALMRHMGKGQAVGVPASQTKRLHALDSLRGVAAMCVFLFHASGVMFPGSWFTLGKVNTEYAEPAVAKWIMTPPFSLVLNGELMVHIFWVLSGFVLARPLLKKASFDLVAKATAKRYFRLLPLPFITTVASFFLYTSGGFFTGQFNDLSHFDSGMFTIGMVPMTFTSMLWEAVFLGQGFNAPLWTVQLELVGSLVLFGLIACTLSMARRELVWGAVLAVMMFVWPQKFMVDFLAGLFIAAHSLRRPDFRLGGGVALLVLAMVVAIGSIHMSRDLSGTWFAWYPALGVWPLHIAATLAVGLALYSQAAITLLSWRPLVWLGERSFALYVVHALTLHTVGQGVAVVFMKIGLAPVAASTLGLGFCVMATFWISDLLTRWVDWPSVNFSNRVGNWLMTAESKTQPELANGVGDEQRPSVALQRPT